MLYLSIVKNKKYFKMAQTNAPNNLCFNITGRDTNVVEQSHFYDLESNGGLSAKAIKDFEIKFKCSFSWVGSYERFNGAVWITARFDKI